MSFPGPWIDPGPMWVNGWSTSGYADGQIDLGPIGNPTGAADAAAPDITAAWPASAFQLTALAEALGNGPPAYRFQEATLRMRFDESNLIYFPDLPPGAIDVELEPPGNGVFLGADSTFTADIVSVATGPGSDMSATNWWFYDADGWHRQSVLFGMVTRTTATFADTTATATLAPGDFTVTSLGGGLTRRSHSLLAVADRQVTGAMLAAAPGPTDIDDARLFIQSALLRVYCHPPRYRFIYDFRPPLAHRQRRDGLASAGPQLAHIGTHGGRPPLAWRQNTP